MKLEKEELLVAHDNKSAEMFCYVCWVLCVVWACTIT